MSANLERIQIIGLYDTSKCIDVQIKDNTLILVGENGSGKTTFLRILFNLLAGRWQELSTFSFKSAILTFDGQDLEIVSSDLNRLMDSSDITENLLKSPISLRYSIIDILQSKEEKEIPQALNKIAKEYGVTMRFISLLISIIFGNSQQPELLFIAIIAKLNAQVLYLPTYRRIERELASVFDGVDPSDLPRNSSRETRYAEAYIELVEFGMQDVEDSIKTELERLEKFQSKNLNELTLRHFGDIVSSAYQVEDSQRLADLSEEEIESVLKRVDESIVGKEQRKEWLKAIKDAQSQEMQSQSERERIICHYFLKIWYFHKSLQSEEKNISTFCSICSQYITDKEFIYDSASFKFYIRPKSEYHDGESVKLSDLSSGEKQIVSLFSHLYLSGKSRYFVLIDEPELSLSVPWQRRFLVDIHKSDFCAGLVAVTHSPFIYKNELETYAHSMGEFVSL